MVRAMESSERQTPLDHRRNRTFAAALPVAALVVAVVAMVAALVLDRPVGLVTRDPNQIAGSPPLAGVLSTLGNGMWAAALGIALFAHRRAIEPDRRYVAALAALTGVLFLDDSLLLHDVVLPNVGVPELLINVAYIAAGLGVLAFTAALMQRAHALHQLLAAGTLFGVSMVWDVLDLDLWGKDLLFAIEDGSKFVGIAFWVVAIGSIAEYVHSPIETY